MAVVKDAEIEKLLQETPRFDNLRVNTVPSLSYSRDYRATLTLGLCDQVLAQSQVPGVLEFAFHARTLVPELCDRARQAEAEVALLAAQRKEAHRDLDDERGRHRATEADMRRLLAERNAARDEIANARKRILQLELDRSSALSRATEALHNTERAIVVAEKLLAERNDARKALDAYVDLKPALDRAQAAEERAVAAERQRDAAVAEARARADAAEKSLAEIRRHLAALKGLVSL
jgi:chromosome segregation ATPase